MMRPTIMRALRILAVAATAALLTACGSNDPDDDTVLEPGPAAGGEGASGTPLVGTTWTLDQVTTSSGETAPEKDAQVAITEEGKLAANSGCNSYGGDAEVDGDQITLGSIIGTLRACEGATGDVDRAFGTVLQGTITAEVTGDVLTLTNADGDSLTFTASS